MYFKGYWTFIKFTHGYYSQFAQLLSYSVVLQFSVFSVSLQYYWCC